MTTNEIKDLIKECFNFFEFAGEYKLEESDTHIIVYSERHSITYTVSKSLRSLGKFNFNTIKAYVIEDVIIKYMDIWNKLEIQYKEVNDE